MHQKQLFFLGGGTNNILVNYIDQKLIEDGGKSCFDVNPDGRKLRLDSGVLSLNN